MEQQPPVGQGLLIIEASRSHLQTPHSIGLLWTSDQPVAETSIWQHTTLSTDRQPCLLPGFEPTIPKSEWTQTHALDRAALGWALYTYLLLQSALQPLWVLACSTIVEYSEQEGFYRVPLPAVRQPPNLEDQW